MRSCSRAERRRPRAGARPRGRIHPVRLEADDAPILSALHPLIVRTTHWINAAAMTVMIMSGWEIHNAHPILPFAIPSVLTSGDGLAVPRNGTSPPCGCWPPTGWSTSPMGSSRAALSPALADPPARSGRRSEGRSVGPPEPCGLVVLQRRAASPLRRVILAACLAVLSGLAIWKPVQFPGSQLSSATSTMPASSTSPR